MARLVVALAAVVLTATAHAPTPGLSERVMRLTRATAWEQVTAIRLPFRTFHPQGMVRVGENFFLSSVEIVRQPSKFTTPQDGYDRDTGAGVGHLFKFGPGGRLLGDLILGEGALYHPGGIDYDERSIWVPVSEYRPNSRAIVYRVDPDTMLASEVFRWPDHIGAIVHDTGSGALVGASWGSRFTYRWPLSGDGVRGRGERQANSAQYIDYQDCHYSGGRRILCSGVGGYDLGDGKQFGLGGIELVDLKRRRSVWQVPVELRSPSGRPMTQNPFWLEPTVTGVRAWFAPDDDTTTLYAFEAATP